MSTRIELSALAKHISGYVTAFISQLREDTKIFLLFTRFSIKRSVYFRLSINSFAVFAPDLYLRGIRFLSRRISSQVLSFGSDVGLFFLPVARTLLRASLLFRNADTRLSIICALVHIYNVKFFVFIIYPYISDIYREIGIFRQNSEFRMLFYVDNAIFWHLFLS